MSEIAHIVFWGCAATLAYTLIGYPLLLSLLPWRREKTAQGAEPTPLVSLIIPARNEESVLRQKLENALQLDYPSARLEILVASDGSTDRTTAIAREYQQRGVKLVDCPQWRGKAATINDAVASASGSLLCLTDANVLMRPDALRHMVNRFEDAALGAVSGDVRLNSHESNFGQGESLYYRVERWLHTAESTVGSMMGVDGGMYVVRRNLFQPLPPDTILDDFAISMACVRQGKRVVYESSAVATENATPTAKAEFRRRVRVAAGAVQSLKHGQWPTLRQPLALWQYLSHKLLRWLGPLLLLLLLLSSAVLWNEGLVYKAMLIALAVGCAASAIATVSLTIRAVPLVGVLFYFSLSHVAMTLGTFKGLFFRQRGTWRRTERATPAVASKVVSNP